MSNDAELPPAAEHPEDGSGSDSTYPLASPEPRAASPETFPVDVNRLDTPAAMPPMQFTLREMFLLITLAAVGLSLLRLLPGGAAPATVAGVAGFGLIGGRLLFWLFRIERPIVYVAWWILLVGYLLSCVGAVLTGP